MNVNLLWIWVVGRGTMAGDGVLVGLWAVTDAGGRWWSPTELRVSGWVGVRGFVGGGAKEAGGRCRRRGKRRQQ
jgi:hypothetical protein